MNIDWSKAPEGATHYREDWHCTSAGGIQYYKQLAKGWRYWGELLGPGWRQCEEPIAGFKEIPRKAVKAWNGEGLPPVGTVCEVQKDAGFDWTKTKVLAHHLGFAVHSWSQDGDDMEVAAAPSGDFRPIRTAEQIAIDEMRQIISSKVGDEDAAKALYLAGYRKVAS